MRSGDSGFDNTFFREFFMFCDSIGCCEFRGIHIRFLLGSSIQAIVDSEWQAERCIIEVKR